MADVVYETGTIPTAQDGSADLLLSLESAGYSLRVEDGRLLLSPASRLTAADRAAITEHKPALIWLLTDSYLDDYRHGDEPVEMVDVRIGLGDGRKTLGNAARWEVFSAWAKEHNEVVTALWAVRKKKRKKASDKGVRKQARKQAALESMGGLGAYGN